MVSETATGRLVFRDTATDNRVGALCLAELHPDECTRGTHNLDRPCLMFGAVPQVDAGTDLLTISYTLRNPSLSYAPGALARIQPAHPPEVQWMITDLDIPIELAEREGLDCTDGLNVAECHLFGNHMAIPDPTGDVIIADTSNSRILWVTPPEDGSEIGTVTSILSRTHPDWGDDQFVNHIQRIDAGESTWLLATFKGQKGRGEDTVNEGKIVLWDVTDPLAATRIWTYPADGFLASVHHGSMHQTPYGSVLLYAHSLGESERADHGKGTVGLATWAGSDPPIYLGDGVLPVDGDLGFVRAASWSDTAEGILITDSGCENAESECEKAGSILLAELPDLTAPGRSGAWEKEHTQQSFFELQRLPLSAPDDLSLPFSSDLLPLSALGAELGKTPLGRCD